MMKQFRNIKDDFMSGIRPGDVLIIERYAHIYEYGQLVELLYDPDDKEEKVVKSVRVKLFENDGEEVVVPVFFVEPVTINTLTLQKLGFDNIERENIYACDGQFVLYTDKSIKDLTSKSIFVSTKSSPKAWIYRPGDIFDRDDEHAIDIKFIYDIQHEYEKLCGKPLDFSKFYVSNNAYDQKKKDYDKFVKDQIRDVLNKNNIYAGSDLAARLLKELSEEYAD